MNERPILQHPEQSTPRAERIASAPYNFVPLPELVVPAVRTPDDLPPHHTYGTEDSPTGYHHTGYFDVLLTTRAPVYVRCPLPLANFLAQEQQEDAQRPFREQIKNTPHFFYTSTPTQPVIPGSSLRGMLRSLLEIVSYGKVQWVTDRTLFFRTVDISDVGQHYRRRMTGKVEAGFLLKSGSGYVIRVCQVVRVSRDVLGNHFYDGRAPNQTPRWQGQPHQWQRVWVQLASNAALVEIIGYEPAPGHVEGCLVLTGNVQDKEKEFVFLLPGAEAEEIPVPEGILERFQDDDQLTQWQERAFPSDQPEKGSRERAGLLRTVPKAPGDPVFFLREDQQLTFLGRAQMFRLPYTQCPLEFVPQALRQPEDIDYADALFGFVRTRQELDAMQKRGIPIPAQGTPGRAYAGRVAVTDATLCAGQEGIWLSEQPLVPKILATPKPTAFQHYLVQPSDGINALKHYGSESPKETVLRGHKRYWHQGASPSQGLSLAQIRAMIEEDKETLARIAEQEKAKQPDTQHTQFKPVKPEVQFRFRVYFENLSASELGALCWTLQPLGKANETYCHHLGMGKPLGLGAVQLQATLYLSNRAQRYRSLFDGDAWQTGLPDAGQPLADRHTQERLTAPFEQHVLQTLQLGNRCQHLADLRRIGMLLKLMEWPGFPPVPPDPGSNRFLPQQKRPNTRYMRISLDKALPDQRNEYHHRPVLPLPSRFGPLTGNTVPTPTARLKQAPDAGRQEPRAQPARGLGISLGERQASQQAPPQRSGRRAPQGRILKKGDKIPVEVLAKEGNRFVLRVLDTGQDDLQHEGRYLPWKLGERHKVIIVSLEDGRVKQVKT